MPVEYEEQPLPPIEVPATNDGIWYPLTDLRFKGHGEEYIAINGHNGSDYAIRIRDPAGGRAWRFRSGQPIEIELGTLDQKHPGPTYLAVVPDGGNIGASEVVLEPIVRKVKRG